jgi:ribonuclease-3
MTSRVDPLARAFGYAFRDERLAEQALRHASVGGADGTDNERLEYLGDALIGFVVAASLFERHGQAAEGELTERRARLVSRAHLAEVARRLGLEALVELRPPLEAGQCLPDSVLAGALEALFAAVYLDGGLDPARRAIQALLLDAPEPEPRANAKAALQHLAQVRFGSVPHYRVLEERAHGFGRTFRVAAQIAGRAFAPAWGRTKREAEQGAAREALLELGDRAAPSA